MNGHMDDDRVQEILDAGDASAEELRHMEACPSCRKRFSFFRSLFSLLNETSLPEPPPGLERKIIERVFPRRAAARLRSRRPIPAWAWATASILLVAGSALLYSTVRVAHAVGDTLLRWSFSGESDLVRLVLRGVGALTPYFSRALEGLKDAAGYMNVMSRTVSLAAQTTEIRLLLLVSAGLLLLLALGWGTRFLLAHNKGGHHGLLCV